jgi:predicted nucleotidyltransferase
MGTKAKRLSPSKAAPRAVSLASALFTTSQQRVMGLLFGQPGRSFYASELIDRIGGGSGAVQRELARLEASGLATVRRVGNQKHFQANPASPIFGELCSIAAKTFALAEPLRMALSPIAAGIRCAFVYGSVAKGADTATSDIDLFVVSDTLSYAEVFGALEPVSATLGRSVNPTVMTTTELAKRRKQENAFVVRVLGQAKVWVIGAEDDLAP